MSANMLAQSEPAAKPEMKFSAEFLQSTFGVITIVEFVLCIIIIICIACTGDTNFHGIGFGIFVAFLGMVVAVAVFCVRSLDIQHRVQGISWMLVWSVIHVTLAFCFFVAGAICIAAASASKDAVEIINNSVLRTEVNSHTVRDAGCAAAFFCWSAAILYAFHAICYFAAYRVDFPTEIIPCRTSESYRVAHRPASTPGRPTARPTAGQGYVPTSTTIPVDEQPQPPPPSSVFVQKSHVIVMEKHRTVEETDGSYE